MVLTIIPLTEDTGRFIGRNTGWIEHRVGTVSDLAMWRFDLTQDHRRRGPGQSWIQAVIYTSDHISRPAAWRHGGIAALLLLPRRKFQFIRFLSRHSHLGSFVFRFSSYTTFFEYKQCISSRRMLTTDKLTTEAAMASKVSVQPSACRRGKSGREKRNVQLRAVCQRIYS